MPKQPKHQDVVKDLQKQVDALVAENRTKEAEAKHQKEAAEKLEKEKNEGAAKWKERQSLMEKFEKDIADAKKTLEADHGDLDAEYDKAGKEAESLQQAAEKVKAEIEKIRIQRAEARRTSQAKVTDIEKLVKETEMEAKAMQPLIEHSTDMLEFGQNDCLEKTGRYSPVGAKRDGKAAELKKARDEHDSYVLKRQQALDKKEELELEDARGVVEAELLKKQQVKLKELVIEHAKNLPLTQEEVRKVTAERDAIIEKTEEVKQQIADIEEQIAQERKVAAEKRDICQAADKELDEITAIARKTATLLKHALQDVEEQNEDLQQCDTDVKELRGNLAATRSLLHDARACQELAEEKEQLVRTRVAQRNDDLSRAKRERDALNDFADGYLREIGHTVTMKQDVLAGELAKHAEAWTSNRVYVTRLPLGAQQGGTGETYSPDPTPRNAALSPQEAGTRDLRERMFQHKDPSQLSATQRAALMCLEKPAKSPTASMKIKAQDDSDVGPNGLSNSNLVGNLVANAVPNLAPQTAR